MCVFSTAVFSVVSYRIDLLLNTVFAVLSRRNVFNEFIQQLVFKQVGIPRKFALRT